MNGREKEEGEIRGGNGKTKGKEARRRRDMRSKKEERRKEEERI